MPSISTNPQHPYNRPDTALSKGSFFGQLVNAVFAQVPVIEYCRSLFTHAMQIPDILVVQVAEADTDLFFPDPLSALDEGVQHIQLVQALDDSVHTNLGQLSGDVYFDMAAYRKDSLRYLAGHPFVRKAVMQAQAEYLHSFFPYKVNINIESGYKSKGRPGFYLSQQRDKVGIYRSDWYYMPVSEIRDFIQSTVHQHTRILPDYPFCDIVKTAGVGMIDLVETRSHSSIYRFSETNLFYQPFDDGSTRSFNGLSEYRSASQLDKLYTRFKYSASRLSLRTHGCDLICDYVVPPYAEFRIVLDKDGFTVIPLDWGQGTEADTQSKILSYVNKKLNKYGRTLPFQKHLTHESNNQHHF